MMKRSQLILGLAIFVACSVAGCGANDPTPVTPTPSKTVPTLTATRPPVSADISSLDARTYPRVDGSTSTQPLQVLLACTILNVPCVWHEEDFLDTTRWYGPDFLRDDPEGRAERVRSIQHSGTHGSYMNLIQGAADLILVARPPSDDELEAALELGVELESYPIALDAFVFLVNTSNPIDSLTLEEIRAIYSGEVSSWSAIGDNSLAIQPYTRNPNSGSQELMESLVMMGQSMIEAPDMMLMSMMGPINAIRDDPAGIGYSVYYYASFIYPDERIKLLAIEGVHPNAQHIAARSYPLTTQVYAVLREDVPQGGTARMLLTWLLTEEGQTAVAHSGYVPILD